MTDAPPAWIGQVLIGLPSGSPGEIVILLDPNGVIPEGSVPGWEWHAAASAWDLRRLYEKVVRHRPSDAQAALIHLTDPVVHRRDQLPWDVSLRAVAAVDGAFPPSVLEALPDLPDDLVSEVLSRARSGQPLAPTIASRILGVALPAPDLATELQLAIRAYAVGLGATVRSLLLAALTSDLARDAIRGPSATGALVTAWRDWCDHGDASVHHEAFLACGPALLTFVEAGYLPPPEGPASGSPAWLTLAPTLTDPTPAVKELLGSRGRQLPDDFEGWESAARWWSRVRWTCATGAVEHAVVETAWEHWSSLDRAFVGWLKENYARELGRSYLPPRTVDKIAPFLAHQLRRRKRPQVLVVMDGMGIAQWNQIRVAAQATEADRYYVMAALPTITRVSRQAIFAGLPPTAFPAAIQSPAEERLWRTFWKGQGLRASEIQYLASDGKALPAVQGATRAAAIVVNVIDEAMHSAGDSGDVGFRDVVSRFAASGYVRGLLDGASSRGWDLWFTADHGNLECRGHTESIPRQGLRVRTRGKRVWTFATSPLRDAANVPGLPWDPPGYPQTAGFPLFAQGRMCYERDAAMVSHGGLSLDEVFVPLVRVEI